MNNITIRDIAKKAGVGVSTVSRALNNHPDIRPDTKEKVLQVIRETGFVPNDSARMLKRTEARTIALLVKGITNPFFSRMIRVIEDYVNANEYTTILRHVKTMEDEVLVAQGLVKEQKLKGIVFLGGSFIYDEHALMQLGVPFVFCTIGKKLHKESEGAESPKELRPRESAHHRLLFSNVAVDDVEASRAAVEYLIGLGHREIGIITEGLESVSVGQLRLQGYREALLSHGIPYREELVFEAAEGIEHFSMPNGYQGARRLLEKTPGMTALFCISDVLAIGACRGIIEAGKRIPEDISVVGFDGIEEGEYYIPSLTTIRQPLDEIATEGIKSLFEMINETGTSRNIIMPAELVVRESTGPVSG